MNRPYPLGAGPIGCLAITTGLGSQAASDANAAMLLLTLRGTPTIYYGDEIGMMQVPIPPDRVHDPIEHSMPGLGLGRDGARTPMQWDSGPSAGFSSAQPWLPLADDFATGNVANQ